MDLKKYQHAIHQLPLEVQLIILKKLIKYFLSGADKIYISKYFFKKYKFIDKISNVYGSQSIVGGLNLIKNNEEYRLLDDETKKINPLDHLKKLIDNGKQKSKSHLLIWR